MYGIESRAHAMLQGSIVNSDAVSHDIYWHGDKEINNALFMSAVENKRHQNLSKDNDSKIY